MKKLISLLLILAVCLSLAACGQSPAAKDTDNAISTIGDITLDSLDAILSAENLYNELTDEEKVSLKNSEILQKSREEYDALFDAALQQLAAPWSRIAISLSSYNLTEAMDAIAALRDAMAVAHFDVVDAFVSSCGEADVQGMENTLINLEATIDTVCIHNTLIAKPEYILEKYASKGGWLVNDHGDFAAYNWWCTNGSDLENAYQDYKLYVSGLTTIQDHGDTFTFEDHDGNTLTVRYDNGKNAILQVRVPRF